MEPQYPNEPTHVILFAFHKRNSLHCCFANLNCHAIAQLSLGVCFAPNLAPFGSPSSYCFQLFGCQTHLSNCDIATRQKAMNSTSRNKQVWKISFPQLKHTITKYRPKCFEPPKPHNSHTLRWTSTLEETQFQLLWKGGYCHQPKTPRPNLLLHKGTQKIEILKH